MAPSPAATSGGRRPAGPPGGQTAAFSSCTLGSTILALPVPTKVLIADDHRLMREGTAALLRSDERIEVVGLAADGHEAVALAERRRPDVALLDLSMPQLG